MATNALLHIQKLQIIGLWKGQAKVISIWQMVKIQGVKNGSTFVFVRILNCHQ